MRESGFVLKELEEYSRHYPERMIKLADKPQTLLKDQPINTHQHLPPTQQQPYFATRAE